MLSNIEEAKAMTNETNRKRAEKMALHGWLTLGVSNPELVDMLTRSLDEAERRGYERGTKELAAKESEISRAAYERAIEDAATLVDRHCGADHVWESLDEVAAMIRAIYAREESNDRP